MRARKLGDPKILVEPPSRHDIDAAFPVWQPVYDNLGRYGHRDELIDEAWMDGGVNDYIDHPPLELLLKDPELVNRCTWWRGQTRRANQDVFRFKNHTWTVVQLVWEKTFGSIRDWMISPQLRGWDQKPMFARPQCCHYSTEGICCNALHYRLTPRSSRSRAIRPEHMGDILLGALDGQTAREIAVDLGLPVEPVRRRITALRREHPAIGEARARRSQYEKGETK